MSIAYGGLLSLLFRGMNLLISLGIVVVTSNQLGADGRGTFVIGLTIVGTVTALTNGLTASVAYQIANQRKRAGDALASGALVSAVLGVLGLIAGAIFAAVLTGDAGSLALPVALSAAAVIVLASLGGLYLGIGALVRYNLSIVLPPLFALAAVFFDLFVLGGDSPARSFAFFAAGQWASVPVLLLMGPGKPYGGFRLERMLTAAIVRFAALAGLSAGVAFLNYRADTFVVDAFKGKAAVAVYANAVYIGEALWQISASFALAAYTRISELPRRDAAILTARLMRHTVVVLFVLCGALFAAAGLVVDILFSEEFRGTANALRLILPGVVLYGAAAALSAFYTYQRGWPWAAALIAGVGLIVDIALAIALVPALGVNGAALASSIAYSTAVIVAVAVFLRGEGLGWREVFRFGRQDIQDYRDLAGRLRAVAARRGSAP